jgi:adenine-specific DNA methylase
VIPKDCKRLVEVDFPIAEVSRHAAREKSIRHGHPSTLHLWWARRPLASSRAVLLGLLWPDPCDPLCPPEFIEQARKLLPSVGGCHPGKTGEDLRNALLKFIAAFANWDNAAKPAYLEVSRALVKAAHGEDPPLVVDPFAGGGSIPVEALRVGCDAFAGDLNPIPYLLCRVLMEDAPRYGVELTEALHDAVRETNRHLRDKIGSLYPACDEGEQPTAYLWSRTIRCDSPTCGAAIPLLRSMWLSRSKSISWALRFEPASAEADGGVGFSLSVFTPKAPDQVGKGTVVGGKAVCPACSHAISREGVEAQLRAQRGGTDSATLVAVMVAIDGARKFRSPTQRDLIAVRSASTLAAESLEEMLESGMSVFPDERINPVRPSPNARGLSAVTRYGMTTFSDLYLPRQRLALSEIVRVVRTLECSQRNLAGAVGRCMLVVLGRCVDRWSSCCRLDSTRDTVTGSFSKQALQMVWDFCEANPFSAWSGGLENAVEWVMRAIDMARISLPRAASVHLGDACVLPLPDQSVNTWFTDPPYYDSVPYADLSDFFFCWLRRGNPTDPAFRDIFDPANRLTPKVQECVWNQSYAAEGRQKDAAFFERCVTAAFMDARRALETEGIGCVVFAHKSTEGWEALLNGLIQAGLSISSSWPIQTEMKARTAARDAASLMGSVHLVCRPRPVEAAIGDWANVLRALPGRVADWMERLQAEGVRGADLVFACIGPALEIFSRYRRVETAEGREVGLTEYLEKVWEVVGRTALGQVLGTAEARARNGAAGAVEEDARLTALFLWTLQSTKRVDDGLMDDQTEDDEQVDEEDEEMTAQSAVKAKGFTLVFDVVRRFAQPLGIELPKWEGRVIETKKGVVRLLPVSERAKQLFGEDGAQAVAARIERETAGGRNPLQGVLFPEQEAVPKITARGARGRGRAAGVGVSDESLAAAREATTLDRVHAAMLLQAGGRTNALRALLKAEQDRGPEFLRLANALSALYPNASEEKRLVDAMLLAVPR